MTALAQAEELIYGEKATAYGDPVENFDRLAALWTPILGVEVTAQQVTLCLLQLKVSRLIHQPGHPDSVIDAAGYIGCYERVTKERGIKVAGSSKRYPHHPHSTTEHPAYDLGNGFVFYPKGRDPQHERETWCGHPFTGFDVWQGNDGRRYCSPECADLHESPVPGTIPCEPLTPPE